MKKEFNFKQELRSIFEEELLARIYRKVLAKGKEFIKLIETEMPKECIEKGQFNTAYLRSWLKKRAGDI